MTIMEAPDLTSKTARMLLFGSSVNEQYSKTVNNHAYSIRIFNRPGEREIRVEVYSHTHNVAEVTTVPKGTRLGSLYSQADSMIKQFERT